MKDRYPGSLPFLDSDLDRVLFKGRETEKKLLMHQILSDKLLVFYSKSGIGKTSLLNAGVFQLLRQNRCFPVSIRINDPKSDIGDLIYQEIDRQAATHNVGFVPGDKSSLWHYFKSTVFWSEEDEKLTVVLVFDQFEEIYTLGFSEKQKQEFISQLSSIVRGIAPKSVAYNPLIYDETPPDVKVVISMREDFVGMLEEISTEIPSILNNRCKLYPLSPLQAEKAIREPALIESTKFNTSSFSYSDQAITEILEFLRKKREGKEIIHSNEIEPFQLQLICQHLEDRILKKEKSAGSNSQKFEITSTDIGGTSGLRDILQNFYQNQLNKVGLQKRRKVRRLCEKELISPTKRRLSIEEEVILDKLGLSSEILSKLVDYRLLRVEPRVGSKYYELSHDTLVKPILDYRSKSRQRRYRLISALLITTVGLLALVFFSRTNYLAQGRRYESEGRYKEAIKSYEEAIVRNPSNQDAIFQLKQVYWNLGSISLEKNEFDSAVYYYVEAYNVDTTDAYSIDFAGFELEKKNEDAALRFYTETVAITPSQTYPYIKIGDWYSRKATKTNVDSLLHKNIERSKYYYLKALSVDPSAADIYNSIGNLYYNTQYDYDSALRYYHEAILIDSTFSVAYTNSGLVFLYAKQQPGIAKSFFRKSIELSPGSNMSYDQLGYIYYSEQNYDSALLFYKKALELVPDHFSNLTYTGVIYDRLKMYDSATFYFQKALDLDSNTNDSLALSNMYLSLTYYSDSLYLNKKYMEALATQNRIVPVVEKGLPLNVFSTVELADAYGRVAFFQIFDKQYSAAVNSAKEGLRIDPTRDWINAFLALGLLLNGQVSDAEKIFLQYWDNKDFRKMFSDYFGDLQKAGIVLPDNPDVNRFVELLDLK